MSEHEKPEGPVNFPHRLPARPIPADYNDKSSPAHVPGTEDWRKPDGPVNRHVSCDVSLSTQSRRLTERRHYLTLGIGVPTFPVEYVREISRDAAERQGFVSEARGIPRGELFVLYSRERARQLAGYVADYMGRIENRNELRPTQVDLARTHDEFCTLVEAPAAPHVITLPVGVTHGDILATVARLAPYGEGELTWDKVLQALLTDTTAGMARVRRVLTERLGVLFDHDFSAATARHRVIKGGA